MPNGRWRVGGAWRGGCAPWRPLGKHINAPGRLRKGCGQPGGRVGMQVRLKRMGENMKQFRWIAVLVVAALVGVFSATAVAEPTQIASHLVTPVAPIGAGETITRTAEGPLAIYIKNGKKLILKTACAASGTQTFFNGPEHGEGNVSGLTFTGCTEVTTTKCAGSGVTVTSGGSFSNVLEANPEEFNWEWVGVTLTIACGNGTQWGTYSGTWSPTVGDIDDVGFCATDDADWPEVFHANGGNGELAATEESPVKGDVVTATGKFAAPPKVVQPWRVPCPPRVLAVRPIAASAFGERD